MQKNAKGTTKIFCYIPTPSGNMVLNITENKQSQNYYLHTDHLGSIISASNQSAEVIYEISLDAYGNQRNVSIIF